MSLLFSALVGAFVAAVGVWVVANMRHERNIKELAAFTREEKKREEQREEKKEALRRKVRSHLKAVNGEAKKRSSPVDTFKGLWRK